MSNHKHENPMQSKQFSITDYSIEELLPHSPPMVLLNSISNYCDESLTAQITIDESAKFYDPRQEGVPAWVGLEYMSQAIAAYSGIHRLSAQQPVKLGFLLGSRKYQIFQKTFNKNATYEVVVTKLYQDGSGLACFDCKIIEQNSNKDNVLCVQSKINVFETDE